MLRLFGKLSAQHQQLVPPTQSLDEPSIRPEQAPEGTGTDQWPKNVGWFV